MKGMEGGRYWIAIAFCSGAFGCVQGESLSTHGLETDPFANTSTTAGSVDPSSASSSDGSGSTMMTTTPQPTGDDSTAGADPTTTTSSETDSPLCGNEAVDPGEDCDDGNEVQADGCNNDCSVSGSVIWEHVHASGQGADSLRGVAVDEEGDPYVCGWERLADGNQIGFLRKYTRQGALDWTRTIAGGSAGSHALRGVGGRFADVVVMGTLQNAGVTGEDIVYARYDPDGNQAWQMGFSSSILSGGFPTPGNDGGFAATLDLDGNPIVAGMVMTQSNSRDVWVRKLTPAGAETWTQTYNSPVNGNDQARGVAVDGTGNVIAVGFEEGAASRDGWIRKWDPDGGVEWTRFYDGAEGLDDRAEGVATDEAGNVYVVGSETTTTSTGRWWVRKIAPFGNEIWTEVDDGPEGASAFGIVTLASGDIAVVGRETNAGFDRALVRKYDEDGNERWSVTFESFTDTHGSAFAVAAGSDEGLFVVGHLDRGVDGEDMWLARLAP